MHIGTPNLGQLILDAAVADTATLDKFYCDGGGIVIAGGCRWLGYGAGDYTVTVSYTGRNYTSSSQGAQITFNISGYEQYETPYPVNFNVTPAPAPSQTPDQNPDASCPGPGCGGAPINFANGDTWIPQTDYSIPGLGGGLSLTRTWNSLWPLMNPPETSGLFGDSWRSNFEERIQSLSGGVVKYWKGNGSALFYLYNAQSGTYTLTAPLDDQTTLSYNSVTLTSTITQKDGTQRVFNSGGYLTSIVDRNGNTTTIVVDGANQNRISSVTDAGGRTLTFNYATPNFPRLCSSIQDSVGTAASYTYDTSGRLTQVAYPDASQFNFSYNDPNSTTLISQVTDSMGKVIEAHTYDSGRRGLTSQQANDANGNPVNKVTVTYPIYSNSGPWLTTVVNSLQQTNSLTFGLLNQRQYLIQVNSAGGCATCGFSRFSSQASYKASGYAYAFLDGYNNNSFTTYDGQGNLTAKYLPDGSQLVGLNGYDNWNYTYSSFGEVHTATDPLGHTTTNNYDPQGNLLTTVTPSPDGGITPGSTTTFTYYSNGTVKTIKDPLGNVTTLTYYPTGLIDTIKDANAKVTTYVYDGRGNRLSIQDPVNGSTKLTTFTYDPMNRLKTITYPGQTVSIQFHYDYRGRRDYVIDQNGFKTIYGYDDADRLISVTDAQSPTAGVTTYTYDTENNLTDIYDAKLSHTHFDYTNSYQLLKTTFPSTYYETYLFDGNGNLQNKTDRDNQRISYNYDYQNRLVRKLYPDSSYVLYTYDAVGRFTQAQDASGTYGFIYDNMDRLTEADTTYAFLSGLRAVKYGYDYASNRNSMIDPQSVQTTYGYDVLNRLNGLTYNGQTPNFTFGYDALSRRNLLTRPNGIATSYGYTPQSWLNSVLHKNSGGTVLDGATYTLDNAGNRKTRTDKRTNVTLTYTPDNIYQLLTAKQGTTTKESYTYDLVGNRLSSLGVSPYNYNSSNELTSTPSGNYTYDNNGNRKSDPSGATYSWDFENRLTQEILAGTGGTVTFKYDPFGRRAQKAFTQNGTTTTTDYFYDGKNLLEEVDNNGNVLARYAQTGNLDEQLFELRSGTTSYYQVDGLGSITSLSNSAGALTNTYTYDSYGNLTASTGTITNPFRFAAREFDPETGIYEYRARYYDQHVGGFLGEDFLRLSDGLTRYDYVLNSPTNYVDPLGLCPWQVRQRPLKGSAGNYVKDWGDPPPSHKYLYNTLTGQSAGLGPVKDPPWYNPGKEVPGQWEPPETPSTNPDDSVTGQVPDSICDCVDRKARNPGSPPNYCALGKPHAGQAPCTNCWRWVLGVLQECTDERNKQQGSQ